VTQVTPVEEPVAQSPPVEAPVVPSTAAITEEDLRKGEALLYEIRAMILAKASAPPTVAESQKPMPASILSKKRSRPTEEEPLPDSKRVRWGHALEKHFDEEDVISEISEITCELEDGKKELTLKVKA